MGLDFKSRTIFIRLTDEINKLLSSPKLKDAVGKFGTELIKTRTRQGFGVKDQEKVELKPLKRATINRRKRSKLSTETTPEKSNFTETGETLDNLTYVKTSTGVEIGVFNKKDAKKVDRNKDRNFLDLTKQEEQAIEDVIEDQLLKSLKRFK